MEDGNSARQKHPSNLRIFVTLAVIFGLLALVYIVSGGYVEGWKWTGIVKGADFPKRTFWDWMELLIVPAALAIGAAWLTWTQRQREREAEEAQLEREREAQAAQKERELEVENQRAQDETLQAYLDQMSGLLLEKNLRNSGEDSEVQTLARARTLTVLERLNSTRKESVVQFLYEAGLISGTHPIIKLTGATLEEVSLRTPLGTNSSLEYAPINLRGAILNRVVFDFEVTNLAGAHFEGALLKRAEFWPSQLEGAHFEGANLEEANFNGASLEGAHFNGANLTGAHFEEERYSRPEIFADEYGRVIATGDLLRGGANLAKAHLEGTNLKGANFNGANLKEAILRGAIGITNEELMEQTTSLEGATMPNGQQYEDWLKSRGEGESGS